MLLHSPQRSRKSQRSTRAQLHSSLSHPWEQEFLFPSMSFHTANAFDIVCRLDRNDTLDEVLKTTGRNLPLDSFWTSCERKTLLGLSLVVLHCSLASFESSVMDCVLHGDFTLQRTITHAVLDSLMNLTLSLITMSVLGFLSYFFLSGDMLRYCHKETICSTT